MLSGRRPPNGSRSAAESPTTTGEPGERFARRRRLGFALAIFGATGLLLFGVALVFVAGPVDEDEGPLGLEGQRRQLVSLLDATSASIVDAQTAVRGADDSLGSTADAAGSAGAFMTELAVTLRQASATLRVNLFGSQPLAPIGDDFERVATRAEAVAADLAAAAGSVRDAGTDLTVLAADLDSMREEIAEIRRAMANRIEADPWRLVVAAMFAWLAIPAAVSLVIGLRLLVPPRRRAAAARQGAAGP